MPEPVALLGSGPLLGALARPPMTVVATIDELDGCAAVVSVSARLPRDDLHDYVAARRIRWLPVEQESGWVTVGPMVRPPRPGCPVCVRHRRARNRGPLAVTLAASDMALPPMVADAVAQLVRVDLDADVARSDGAIVRISVLDASVRRHRFLPDPLCPRCAVPQPDEAVAPARRPLPKPRPSTFRIADLASRETELLDTYVDAETGLVGSLGTGSPAGVPTAVARLAPGWTGPDSRHGYGRAGDYRTARLVALAEAVERSAGNRPRGERTVVHGSYEELRREAIDPRTLGTPVDELYRSPGYPLVPFDPAARIGWVRGRSWTRSLPVLVPERIAHPARPSPTDWVVETSNGCAVGSCLEEAVLHGLLEIAERDAFLMTWYARLRAPRLDLDSVPDRRVPLTAELLRQRLGYEAMVFPTMLEQRVPTFLVVAVNRDGTDRPALACATAAHLDPAAGVLSAIREVAATLDGMAATFDPGAAEPMLTNCFLVRDMADHAAVYAHPAALPRLDFLLATPDRVTLEGVTRRVAWPLTDDLSKDLDELLGRYRETGLDVIAVDTTTTEQRAGGFHSVKVLVPGTIPLTFGHAFRRTAELPRLHSVPRMLGHRPDGLLPAQLNPFPHPLP